MNVFPEEVVLHLSVCSMDRRVVRILVKEASQARLGLKIDGSENCKLWVRLQQSACGCRMGVSLRDTPWVSKGQTMEKTLMTEKV